MVGQNEFGVGVAVLPVVKDAFFGQQALDEDQGCLAILNTIFPWQVGVVEAEFMVVDAVFDEDLFDDIRHAGLLEDPRIGGEVETVEVGVNGDFVFGPVAGIANGGDAFDDAGEVRG